MDSPSGSAVNKAYKRRTGTTDSGRDYEHKMLALFCIRCILQEPERIWLVTNADDVGDFDDIILHMKTRGSPGVTYMLQMKHEDKQSNLTRGDFTHTNKPFNLSKHAKGFSTLRETLQKSDKSSDCIENLDPNNIVSVFFTNRPTPTPKFDFFKNTTDDKLRFLNTHSDDYVYKIDFEKITNERVENEDYCRNVYFLSNQVNEADVDAVLLKEVENLTKHIGLIKVDGITIAQKLKDYVIKWAKCKLGDTFYLTKEGLLYKFAEIFLCENLINLHNEPCLFYDCPTKEIWNAIVQDKSITHVDYEETTLKFLKKYVGSEVRKTNVKVENTWGCNLSNKNKKLFYKKNKDLQTLMFNLVGKNESLTMLDIYKSLWLANKVPLILEVDAPKKYQNILKILEWSNVTLRIIILNKTESKLPLSNPKGQLVTLQDLNVDHKKKILEQPVNIQGRNGLTLGEVMDESLYEHVKCCDIIRILSQNYNIGNIHEPTDEYFIERSLHKTLVRFEILLETKDETFMIHNKTSPKILMDKLKHTNVSDGINSNIIILQDINPMEVQELKSERRSIHRFAFSGENFLEWQESSGSTNLIKKFIINPLLQQDEIFSVRDVSDTECTDDDISESDASERNVSDYEVSDDGNSSREISDRDLSDLELSDEHSDHEISDKTSHFEDAKKVVLDFALLKQHSEALESCTPAFNTSTTLKHSEFSGRITDSKLSGANKTCEESSPVKNNRSTKLREFPGQPLEGLPRVKNTDDGHPPTYGFSAKVLSDPKCSLLLGPKVISSESKNSDALSRQNLTSDVYVMTKVQSGVTNMLNRTHIVSGCPGMGKTVLINFISNEAPPDLWVFKIILNDHDDYYDDMKSNKNAFTVFDHIKYFGKQTFKRRDCVNVQLTEAVFYKLLKEKKVIFLIDGFDEISVSYRSEVTDIIKSLHENEFHVWITTRPHMNSHLEEQFDTIAITLKAFSLEDQKRFFMKYFTATLDVEDNTELVDEFAGRLIEVAKNNLNDWNFKFMGVPLQSKLLAEVFSSELQRSLRENTVILEEKFDTLYLYEEFVKKKKIILCKKYGKGAKEKFSFFDTHQKMLALKILFNKYNLCELGIDEQLYDYYKDKPKEVEILQREGFLVVFEDKIGTKMIFGAKFVHRTVAEYLSAQWLIDNYKNPKSRIRNTVRILIENRFRHKAAYSFLFRIFDSVLSKGFPLHTRIINEEISVLEEIVKTRPDALEQLDGGNRSLLHLVALYTNSDSGSAKERLHQNRMNNIIADVILQIPTDKLAGIKEDDFGYNPLDYAIKTPCIATADKLCQKLQNVTMNIASHDYKHHIKLTDVIPQYGALLKKLYQNFIYFEALDDDVKEDTDICNYFNTKYHLRTLNSYLKNYMVELQVRTFSNFLERTAIKFQNAYQNLQFAVAFGTVENVKELLAQGSDVNRISFGHVPLCGGIKRKRSDILEILHLLLEKEMDININCADGSTSLHAACQVNYFTLVQVLLKNGANINQRNKNGRTCLFVSLQNQNVEIAKFLLEKGADVDHVDRKDNSCLHLAAKTGLNDIVLQLVEKGVDVNKQNKHGETPLFLAVKNKHDSSVALLLENHAKVDIVDRFGDSPLHNATKDGEYEIVQQLIQTGVDINKPTEWGETPLLLAFKHRKMRVAKLLLENEAEITDNTDFLGNSYLHSIEMDEDLLRQLIRRGVDINKKNQENETPLLYALKNQNVTIAGILLESNAQADDVDLFGNSCLHWAAKMGDDSMVLRLIDKGLDVNKQSEFEKTPLLLALEHKHLTTAKLLIAKGAIIDFKTSLGDSHLHYAAWSGCLEKWIEILSEHSEQIDLKTTNGKKGTLLHYAVVKDTFKNDAEVQCQMQMLNFLIKNGIDVNMQDFFGDTALHLLSKFIYSDEVPLTNNFRESATKLILNTDINVTITNTQGKTALDLATDNNNKTMIFLIQRKINRENSDAEY